MHSIGHISHISTLYEFQQPNRKLQISDQETISTCQTFGRVFWQISSQITKHESLSPNYPSISNDWRQHLANFPRQGSFVRSENLIKQILWKQWTAIKPFRMCSIQWNSKEGLETYLNAFRKDIPVATKRSSFQKQHVQNRHIGSPSFYII